MTTKKAYIKPKFEYWPAAELDAIQAQMSGGGGGTGFYYVWDSEPEIWDSSSVLDSVVITTVVAVVVFIATKNANLSWQVGGLAAGAVASAIVALNLDVVYYRNYGYLLRAFHVNPAVAGFVAGEARVTEYFADENHSFSLDTPTMYTNVSSDAQYRLIDCPGYELINSL
jgi:hypothetical protein